MPFIAGVGELLGRLTGGAADLVVQLAAVGVAVQGVMLRANLATRRRLPADWENVLSHLPPIDGEGDPVRSSRRLEHHDASVLSDIVNILEQWTKQSAVVIARP